MTKKMKLVIAGSRFYADTAELNHILEPWSKMHAEQLVVVTLNEKGATTLGADWAKALGFAVERWGADRPTLGKAAGYMRNRHLVLDGDVDAMLVIRDQRASKEHDHLIKVAKQVGIKVHVHKTVTESKPADPNQGDMLNDQPEFNQVA